MAKAEDKGTRGKLEELQALRDEALHSGDERAVERQRARGKLLARERIEKLLDPGSFVELDRYVRHRNSALRDDGPAALGGRRRHRLRDDLRPEGLRLLAGLHGLRGHPLGGLRREDLQGDGPRAQVRLPCDRHQRLGRRADPGRRRLARRLRGDLLAQRSGLGRRAADQPRHGPDGRRSRLLAGDDRLRPHGQGDLVHVHHGARGREDGDR